MPTLFEKIEANANKRLPLAPGHHPKQELARYRDFLKVESHRLKILHRSGEGGQEICRARAHVLDLLLQHLWRAVRSVLPPTATPPSLTLVALGGYGRGELNPHSDIDLMFLHGGDLVSLGKANSYMAGFTDAFLYTLWDVGLKVGHSVRSIDDCVRIANSDMQSKTSLIEARFVEGDHDLFKRMQSVVLARAVRGFEKEYIQARLEDQEARRAKYGNSASMQEPNIKNGCGGLRDYQNLLWMAFFKYRARSLEDLQRRELITAAEVRQLDSAYDFLLRVRNELHYRVNRPIDVLAKSHQPAIAHALGFTERSPRKRLEMFMRTLYKHQRNIDLITRTIEQRLALWPAPKRLISWPSFLGRPQRTAQVVDGFKIADGEIHYTSPDLFKQEPRRLMRVFLYAQQRGLRLHPDLAQLIRNQLSLVNKAFLRDPHVHESFKEILSQRGNVAPVLRSMHEVEFLGKYLPEFGKLTCLVQHEFYHQYTADEHTLMCIQKLDEVWDAEQAPAQAYRDLFQELDQPFLLYLALLLHDSGKAYPDKNHSEKGRQLALRVAKRLELDGAATHRLCLVIEHHLTMAQVSQRRDLDDPAVIQSFASLIQTPETLAVLTLHTFADSQGTSDKLWNGFKDTLLWTLYHKTMQLLTGGAEFARAEQIDRELLQQEVERILPPTFSSEEIDAHFQNVPTRYFKAYSARQIALHLTLTHRFMHLQLSEEERALEAVIHWQDEPDRGYAALTVCTWDRAGLFAKISGSLTAAALNILSAQIFTRTDGIIIDTFFVTNARTGLLPTNADHEKFEKYLNATLTSDTDLDSLIARHTSAHTFGKNAQVERIPTNIQFDNESSDQYTIIEIETEDRIGLLYRISELLAELGIDISVAKICTEKGAAIDSFYVHQQMGGKVDSPELQQAIAEHLKRALGDHELAAAS